MKLKSTCLGYLFFVCCVGLLVSRGEAANYTWTGTSGNLWATASNWSPNTATPSTSDTAYILNSSTNQSILYTASASGTVGGLSITQTTSGGTNTVQIIKGGMMVLDNITLGGGDSTAVSQIFLDPSQNQTAAAGLGQALWIGSTAGSGTITLNAGGLLSLGAYCYATSATTGNQYLSTVKGTINVNGGVVSVPALINPSNIGIGGFNLNVDAVNMTSGTIYVTGISSTVSPRFNVNGNFNSTGGTIYLGTNADLALFGNTNSIGAGTTISGPGQIFLWGNSLSVGCYIPYLAIRANGNSTRIVTSSGYTSGSAQFGTLQMAQTAAGGTSTIKLGSDLSAAIFNVGYDTNKSADVIGVGADLNGHKLSLPSLNWNPKNSASQAIWNIDNSSATSGTIMASGFLFNSAYQFNLGAYSTGEIVLTATGAGVGNHLGLATNGSTGANTTFSYVGNGVASLTSYRSIGRLMIGDGNSTSTLNLITTGETVLGDITVAKGSVLNLLNKSVTETGGRAGLGGLNGGGSVYTNGGDGGTGTLILNTSKGDGYFTGNMGNATGSGSGILALTLTGGAGKQTLAGTNSYTGNTTIGAGNTLQLGDGTSDGVISGSSKIVNSGNLVYNIVGTQVYSGTISGSGTVSMIGAGTQILSGANTYTGATVISGGTLQIGAGGTTGALATSSAITDNGTLVFNRTDTVTQGTHFANTISGTGGVTQAGAGKLILGGNNTYTGATIVAAGEMDINGALSAMSAVTVQAGATLGGSGTANGTVSVQSATVNGNGLNIGAATFDGQSSLSGTTTAASVTVNSGTTTASGVTTSNGNLSIIAGATLKNTGSFSANIVSVANTATLTNNGTLSGTVNVSGLLTGTGTLNGALTIKTNGELAPGNSPGVTTVSGSLTVETGAKVSMQIEGLTAAGGDYDQIVVTGASSLVTLNTGSILNLTIADGVFTEGALTLIENQSDNAIVGTFSSVVIGGSTYDVSTTNKFVYGGKEYELLYNVNADGGSTPNDFELAVVPEPGTWAMLVGGLGMLLGAQRMRRKSE